MTAFFGPYAPDLQGFVRTFGTSAGYYDANGQYARISAVFNNFKLGAGNALAPTQPAGRPAGSAHPRTAPLPRRRRDALAGRRLGALHRRRQARLQPQQVPR